MYHTFKCLPVTKSFIQETGKTHLLSYQQTMTQRAQIPETELTVRVATGARDLPVRWLQVPLSQLEKLHCPSHC